MRTDTFQLPSKKSVRMLESLLETVVMMKNHAK